MRGHEEASGTGYVPREQVEEWARKDPVRRYEAFLAGGPLHRGRASPRSAPPTRRGSTPWPTRPWPAPEPRSTLEEKLADVFAPSLLVPTPPRPTEAEAPELRYVDAISDGLRTVMRRDDTVLLLGQDIAEYGGVFKVTEGFVEEFGKARVRNTPIIESGAVGCALGLALAGRVPMVEMQFGDFITCGFNQIVNNLAKTHWRWGGRVPVVIRAPVGGGTGAGPFHSQCIESWFTAVAGIKVVAPATPYDAKGLFISAFEDGNPVLYLEHKLLYRSARGPVPAGHYSVPLGRARVARPGRDATIVTYGVGVPGRSRPRRSWPRGPGPRGGRPALARPVGRRGGRALGGEDRPVPRPPRGAPHRRLRRRGGGHGGARGVRVAGRGCPGTGSASRSWRPPGSCLDAARARRRVHHGDIGWEFWRRRATPSPSAPSSC
jgi:2-oxoisovalerate dehydrogenase E1 component